MNTEAQQGTDVESASARERPVGVSRRTAIGLCIVSAGVGAGAVLAIPRLLDPHPRTHAWGDLAQALLPMAAAEIPALREPCEAALANHDRALGTTSKLAGFTFDDAGVTAPGDTASVRRAFENRIAGEFSEGRVVIVDRWVLSETQAALCALAARASAEES